MTKAELIAALEPYPEDMPVRGYDYKDGMSHDLEVVEEADVWSMGDKIRALLLK